MVKSIKAAAKRAERENQTMAKSAGKRTLEQQAQRTVDSFQNFALNLGIGTGSALTGSTYGFNPITRIRTLLEWIHRGSWLGGIAVDLVADDMTRAGVEYKGGVTPEITEDLDAAATKWNIWGALNDTVKWSRLYGGCIAVILIDGQDPSTPLRLQTVGRNMFKGLLVLDRWMVEPSLNNLVTDYGPQIGNPKFYTVTADAPALSSSKIHYSRVVRLEGIRLPYWQRISENLWGLSVIERLYDRMVAFDSATTGAAQLVYKSYLRTLKLKNFREASAAGGDALKGIVQQVNIMRQFQGMEGISIIDADDEFTVDGTGASFSGISEALLQFGQQLSGALQIPLVRLFGQSPAGLSSTGESDIRTYYDGIKQQQNKNLHEPVTRIYMCMAVSEGIPIPDEFGIEFRSLWELSDSEKATIAGQIATAVASLVDSAVIDPATALSELRQSSRVTGIFTNVTDEDITAAKNAPPVTEIGVPEPEDLGGEEGITARKVLGDSARIFDIGGFPIHIETPMGETRTGTGKDGKPWFATMAADYGFFQGTASAEGYTEAMDCFVGPLRSSPVAYVIDQMDADTGLFDEHKVMLGYRKQKNAVHAYRSSFSDNRNRIMKVTPMTFDELRKWLKEYRP